MFVLQHCFNKSMEGDMFHEIVDVFNTKDGAISALNRIKASIANSTAHYFKDTDFGWLNPKEVESLAEELGYVDDAIYEWYGSDGEKYYTKFYITEHQPRD